MLRGAAFVCCLALLASTSCAGGHAPEAWELASSDIVIRHHRALGIDYVEVVPAGVREDAALPMLVFLHGRGSKPRIPDGPFLGLASPVRAILPRAPDPLGHGYTWLPASARDGESPELVAGIEETSRRLASFVEILVDRHDTLGAPIVMGFSQGGILALALAVHHPDVVGAAFPLAGWLPPSLDPGPPRPHVRYPPIRAMHGTDDPILRIERTRTSVAALETEGYDIELWEYEGVEHRMTLAMWRDLRKWLELEIDARIREGERARGGLA